MKIDSLDIRLCGGYLVAISLLVAPIYFGAATAVTGFCLGVSIVLFVPEQFTIKTVGVEKQ